jgi:hypothetical protein
MMPLQLDLSLTCPCCTCVFGDLHGCDNQVDAVIGKIQSLQDQGGGTYGVALADGMAAAGEALLAQGGPATERHCVVITGSTPLEKSQAGTARFEAGMGNADVARRLAQNGVLLSVFSVSTHNDPIILCLRR